MSMGIFKMNAKSKILVTGGGGFLGTHVVELLKSRGFNNLFIPRQKDYNLTKEEDVIKMYKDAKPEILIHLASHVSGLGDNFKYQADFFYKNIMIGTLVLHHAWKNNVKNVVATSAGCGYPEFAPVPLNENDYWNGFPQKESAPYSLAKRMLHIQSLAYWKQHAFPIKIILPGNIYGPHDNYCLNDGHVIPALTQRCYLAKKEKKPFRVLGSGTPLRQFIYSEDLAKLFMWTLENYDKKETLILSVGEKNEVSIKKVATEIAKSFNYEHMMEFDTRYADGQYKKTADNTKLMNLIGKFKFTTIEDGIKKNTKWFIENFDDARK